jgi:hypothetical protein
MSRTIPVFVNSALVRVESDATALDAVRAWNAAAAHDVEQGLRIVTDSRGLPIEADAPVHGGAIFRLIPARARDAESDADLES